jgi:hypothetical protein
MQPAIFRFIFTISQQKHFVNRVILKKDKQYIIVFEWSWRRLHRCVVQELQFARVHVLLIAFRESSGEMQLGLAIGPKSCSFPFFLNYGFLFGTGTTSLWYGYIISFSWNLHPLIRGIGVSKRRGSALITHWKLCRSRIILPRRTEQSNQRDPYEGSRLTNLGMYGLSQIGCRPKKDKVIKKTL